MSESNVPAVVRTREERVATIEATVSRTFTPEQITIIKNTVAKGATDAELQYFIAVAGRTGLDPFTHQIHFVKRYDASIQERVGAIQTGIDGYRLIAQRSGQYEGQTPPEWCGKDGKWVGLWTHEEPPFAARIGVYRHGFRDTVWGIARWDAYVQTKADGSPNKMWREMGPEQLAKCAEAQALRRAFPNELSALYTNEEMARDRDPDDDLGKPLPAHYAGEVEKARRLEAATEPAAARALEVAAEAIAGEGDGAGGDKEVAAKEDAPAPPAEVASEQEAGPAQPVLSADELMMLGKRAHAAFKNKRLIVKEAPINSGKWFLVDHDLLVAMEYPNPETGRPLAKMTPEQRLELERLLLDLTSTAQREAGRK